MIFVVDCADRDRIDEARQELHRIINDREMREAIILIFANKQDLPEGMLISVIFLSKISIKKLGPFQSVKAPVILIALLNFSHETT